ncbi:MAG: hypothetical protein WCW77_03710 [Patescibacteria group bacterium]
MKKHSASATITHPAYLDEVWTGQNGNAFLKSLKAHGFSESFPCARGFFEAFANVPEGIVCSDERVRIPRMVTLDFVAQLLLADEEDLDRFVHVYKGRLPLIFSHSNCGGSLAKYEELRQFGNLPKGTHPDDVAIAHTQKLGRELESHYSHLVINDAPHTARGVFVDGTGRLDSWALDAPPFFKSSAAGCGLSPEFILKEVSTICSIARGGHSFGARFTPDRPFYVLVTAKDDRQRKALHDLCEEVAEAHNGCVKVGSWSPE